MRLYADTTALAAYPGGTDVPAEDAPALLRAASRMVDELLRLRAYDVDTDGLPTDTDDLQATSDAACAIVVELHSTGAMRAGATQEWDSVAIGGVSLSGRKSREGGTVVLGLPVPAIAAVHLSDVGVQQVTVSGGSYVRPLDRIAR